MKGQVQRIRLFLEHMQDAAAQIVSYTSGTTAADFLSDRLLQDAVIRNVEILGEASRRVLEVDPTAATKFPDIPFAAIYAMRNQLSHGYFTVDQGLVWRVVERDVPLLKEQLAKAIAECDRAPNP